MNLSLASNDQDDDVKTAVTVVIKRFMNCSPGFSWTTGPIMHSANTNWVVFSRQTGKPDLEICRLSTVRFYKCWQIRRLPATDNPLFYFAGNLSRFIFFPLFFTFFLPTKLSNPVFTHVRLPSNWSLGTTLENKHGEPIHSPTKCRKFPWKRDEIHLFRRCFDSEFSDTSRVNLC